MTEARYLVAGRRPWNLDLFDRRLAHLPGGWTFVATREELDAALGAGPHRYIFFLHWSSIVPHDVLAEHECVCFHMTDVPYGRGGSPLQNLIVRGHTDTRLTALRMTDELDGGPVYLKRDLALHGSAEEIYIRAGEISADMIEHIVEHEPTPAPQDGPVEPFPRRTPAQSQVPGGLSLSGVHDHIRMLDAKGYPPAFIETAGLRFEFRRAVRYDGRVEADVCITVASPPVSGS
jgi:methionyl-tRNA formyltransferase